MRRWVRASLSSLLLASGCARLGYVAITVQLGSLTGKIDRLALEAFDSIGDAGPMLVPSSGPVPEGIPNDVVLSVSTTLGNNLTVVVQGLGPDGGVLGVASGSIASASGTTKIELTLSPPCATARDCDPTSVCTGTIDCVVGVCQTVHNQTAVTGTACGPSDGGQCDGNGACLLPYCGTGLHPLPPDEQCDEGVGLNGNLPDHCRADCQLPSCGDGIVDPDAGELCDLGSQNNGHGLGCNATCDLRGAVSVLAGNGQLASTDGIGRDAGFAQPGAVAVLAGGLYVADQLTRLIRRIDLTSLQVTTVAGGFDGGACHDTDGQGSEASFCLLNSLQAYDEGLLVGDVSALRFVDIGGGVSTYAGILPTAAVANPGYAVGSFAKSSYAGPVGLALILPEIYSSTILSGVVLRTDPIELETFLEAAPFPSGEGGGLTALNSMLFADDSSAGTLARIDPDGGASTVVAHGLNQPQGLCAGARGVYIAEAGSRQMQELAWDAGQVSLVAGGALGLVPGLGADAGFLEPFACVYDPITRTLYVSDPGANVILAIQ